MPKAWKEWEGRVVNKEFRLGDYLGGSDRAGVFMTQYGPESLKAAVKLIPAGTLDQATLDAELSRLQSARELSHPYLLQIFQAGRTQLDDTDLLFVVMEYAEEDLSQFLPKRPLTPAELREMLGPTLEALAYLHGKGFVHGRLKPANVMAIGDQLKLSSDGISRSGEQSGPPGQSSYYDAPEIGRGENEAASDVWSLGMLLVVALTQDLPGWDAGENEPVLPEKVPPPFDDIARHCLRRDPRARWGLAEIAARSGVASPVASTAGRKAEFRQPGVAPRAAAGPQLAVLQRKGIPAPANFPYKGRSNAGLYVAAVVVAMIVGVLVVPRLFRGVSNVSNSEQITPTRAPARASAEIAPVRDQGAGHEESGETNSRVGGEPGGLFGTRGRTVRRVLTAGQVAEQVLPNVPQSARETIRGTVRVGVRISVDSSGNVTEAELDSAGPSKYFARLALEAAQQWKFEPPKVEGQNVLSDWLLRFQFTGKGTRVIPEQSDP
jgi:TonB family protein